MEYSSDQTSCLQFLDFLGNELLPFQGLLSDFLLDRSGMWADNKVVLNYLPRNTEDIRWLLGKHIDIRLLMSARTTSVFPQRGRGAVV